MADEKPVIVFESSASRLVLDLLDKEVNGDGLIVEKGNRDQKVLSFDGNEMTIDEFGGVKKGSEIFIENNLVSLMKISKE